ncbi:hypothetical protein [Lacticaseibacillus hegangensis]|uniref:Uncharacterized protein n=1 Tax=Lacticaseibacillus hegangensis TaxID=2486010 RepID=A0ABW4CY51_9LACO|nr:hypothetical protein [Lacticaseibacillus hegangensis]
MKDLENHDALSNLKAITSETSKQINAVMNAERTDTELRLILKTSAELQDSYKHERESERYQSLIEAHPELKHTLDENIDSIISEAGDAAKEAKRTRRRTTILYVLQFPLCVFILIGVISLLPSFKASILDKIFISPKHLEVALQLGFLTGAFVFSISNALLGISRLWINKQNTADTVDTVMRLSTRISILVGISVFSLEAFNVTQFAALSSLISIFTLLMLIIPKKSLGSLREAIRHQGKNTADENGHGTTK